MEQASGDEFDGGTVPVEGDLKTTSWIAKNFDLNPETVRLWARRDLIPYERIGSVVRIPYFRFCEQFRLELGAQYISARTISRRFSITPEAVRKWVYEGKVEGVRLFGSLRISEAAIDAIRKRR